MSHKATTNHAPAHTMKHIHIQIDPSQATEAREALAAFSLRSRIDGDSLTVPAHDDGTQIERILKNAGVRLFSGPETREGSGL